MTFRVERQAIGQIIHVAWLSPPIAPTETRLVNTEYRTGTYGQFLARFNREFRTTAVAIRSKLRHDAFSRNHCRIFGR